MLDPTDLEKGDELVCIDPAGYLRQDPDGARFRRQVLSMPIIFNGIRKGRGLILTNEPCLIPFDALQFFIKKPEYRKPQEGPLCDFKALIDVTHKALQDGLIENYCVSKDGVNICTSPDEFLLKVRNNEKSIAEAIEAIQSFYKQPFVIKSEEDIARITGGCEVTLSNGNKTTVEGWVMMEGENRILLRDYDHPVWFFILKGATVEYPK